MRDEKSNQAEKIGKNRHFFCKNRQFLLNFSNWKATSDQRPQPFFKSPAQSVF
jgi:hypothetical protein